jgi:hypothetical protein
MMKPEVQRRKQRARERQECPVHSYMRHGKEASELRDGVQEAIDNHSDVAISDLSGDDARHLLDSLLGCLRGLLESVDARDSLAYLERCPEDVIRRTPRAKAPR